MHSYIDHTILNPTAQYADIQRVCQEALAWKFASVCVNPYFVPVVKKTLQDSSVKTCSVVAFPFGATSEQIKCAETQYVLDAGADEVDMVINIALLKDGNEDALLAEINTLSQRCHQYNAILKVIVETCYLTEADIKTVCRIIELAGADFIKTSTGYGSRGASLEDIILFKKYLKKGTKIKASGGIRSAEDARRFIEAGCSRIGTSRGVTIMEEFQKIL